MPAQPVPASITWSDGLGTGTIYTTSGRFDNWIPDGEDIGRRTTNVGQGLTFLFAFRRDYTATFEMSSLGPAAIALMTRFKVWAEGGGTFTVNTQDRVQNAYTCVIKPGARITWTWDRQLMVFTMMVAAKNTASVAMQCLYSSFLGAGYTILVTPSPLSIGPNVGTTVQLTATVLDPQGNPVAGAAITWSSSNPLIAKVDQTGLVTALATGSCNIIATSGSTSTNVPCAVNITQVPVTITFSPTTLAFTATTYTGTPQVGKSGVPTQSITATVLNGSGQSVPIVPGLITWTTSGGGVSISDNGAGVVTVTAIAGNTNGNITATIVNADGSQVQQSVPYTTVAEVPAVLVPSTSTLTLQAVGQTAPITVQTIGQYGNVIP